MQSPMNILCAAIISFKSDTFFHNTEPCQFASELIYTIMVLYLLNNSFDYFSILVPPRGENVAKKQITILTRILHMSNSLKFISGKC